MEIIGVFFAHYVRLFSGCWNMFLIRMVMDASSLEKLFIMLIWVPYENVCIYMYVCLCILQSRHSIYMKTFDGITRQQRRLPFTRFTPVSQGRGKQSVHSEAFGGKEGREKLYDSTRTCHHCQTPPEYLASSSMWWRRLPYKPKWVWWMERKKKRPSCVVMQQLQKTTHVRGIARTVPLSLPLRDEEMHTFITVKYRALVLCFAAAT